MRALVENILLGALHVKLIAVFLGRNLMGEELVGRSKALLD